MLPFWGRGPNVLYLCPSKAQMNRKCCYISVASIRQWMKLCTRGTSLGIQTTNTPRVNTIVCFDLPDFKGGEVEASSHPRHSDNTLHRGRASGTLSEGKLHEHEQTCHSDWPVIPSPGSHKELAAEALSLHFLSTRGAWWEPSFCYLSGKARLHVIIFPTQTGKPWGIIFN